MKACLEDRLREERDRINGHVLVGKNIDRVVPISSTFLIFFDLFSLASSHKLIYSKDVKTEAGRNQPERGPRWQSNS